MRSPPLLPMAILTMTLTAAAVAAGHIHRNARAADLPPSSTQTQSTPLESQVTWALGLLNGEAARFSEEELSAHIAPELLASMPAEQLAVELEQLAPLRPLRFQGFTRPPTSTQAVALLTGAGDLPLVVPITVEATAPHRITDLTFAAVPAPAGVAPQPNAAPVDFAGRFDIGGRSLYLACRGSGSPTVVLESGLGDSAAPWFAVESAVAGFTRVCSYDRANTLAGASDPAPTPRAGWDVVADLHALLQAAGVPGPYVLVGHSIGGHFARLYAGQYPNEVTGMVLVDASHEGQDAMLAPLVGASPEPEAEPEDEPEPPNPEGIIRNTTAAQVRATRTAQPLPPMPLVVITAARSFHTIELPPGISADALAQMWRDLGADLATLLPGGRQIIAEQSAHYVHQSEPELVIDAVRDVVEAVRRQGDQP